MLRALYDYAVREDLALPAGYGRKQVRAYVSLDAEGRFLGVMPGGAEKTPCPDIGSMANSGGKCNVLAEKRCILFPGKEEERQKYAAKAAFFRETLTDAAQAEPRLALCLRAMEDADTAAAVSAELDRQKLDGAKVLSFLVAGASVLEMPAVKAWWAAFREQLRPSGGEKALCLITGRPAVPLATTPPVSGLAVVGGHARGDALICFDKDAFCSYGLKQAANAPVSEEAYAGVKAALDSLLADAPVLAGMKFVHWYDRPLDRAEDGLLFSLGAAFPDDDEEDDEEDERPGPNVYAARRAADALVGSVVSGEAVHELPQEYFILLLSGAGGRVMVRSYQRGNYRELTDHLRQWEDDLALTNRAGTGPLRPVKLRARLIRLMSRQNSDRNLFERMSKELSGLTPAIVNAITGGGPLPDAAARRALAYLRAQMFSGEESEGRRKTPDPMACQWLKAWLCRRERMKYEKEELTVEYNERHPEPAYHCGALMAVYAEIQYRAMGEVNASVTDRYYAAASQTPALVLGQLSRMCVHHLDKLGGLRRYYAGLLERAACAVGNEIPAVLKPEQQAYFALGCYQMSAQMERERAARIAAAKANKENG